MGSLRLDQWNRLFKDLHSLRDCIDEWDYEHGRQTDILNIYNALEYKFEDLEEDEKDTPVGLMNEDWERVNDILDCLGRFTITRNKKQMRICFTAEFIDAKEAMINLHYFGKEI